MKKKKPRRDMRITAKMGTKILANTEE